MATSTAIRYRNRAEAEAITLLDFDDSFREHKFVSRTDSFRFSDNVLSQRWRTISRSDSFDVADIDTTGPKQNNRIAQEFIDVISSIIARHQKTLPGDTIQTTNDSSSDFLAFSPTLFDSLTVTDAIVLIKTQRRTLSEFVSVLDDGFITDRDILRYRKMVESIELVDGFVKSIQRADFVINSKIKFDSIAVNDSILVTLGGIKVRTLTDSLTVSEKEFITSSKIENESFTLSDSAKMLRVFQRVLLDTITITDDVIVGRSSITNTKLVLERISDMTDKLVATFTNGTNISVTIKHGIENQ